MQVSKYEVTRPSTTCTLPFWPFGPVSCLGLLWRGGGRVNNINQIKYENPKQKVSMTKDSTFFFRISLQYSFGRQAERISLEAPEGVQLKLGFLTACLFAVKMGFHALRIAFTG